MVLTYRNVRVKRLGLPVAHGVAALLIIIALYRIFHSPQSAQQSVLVLPAAPLGPLQAAKLPQPQAAAELPPLQHQQVNSKLSDIVSEVRHELESKEGRAPGKQELVRRVQAEIGRLQMGIEAKDYEGTGGHRHSRVSLEQLRALPRPRQVERPDVLLRPSFKDCEKGKEPLFLVLVHTRASEIAYRNAIRETWYSPTKSHTKFLNTRPHLWKVIFTTGSGNGANLQREIYEESRDYGDILQFRFLDTPHSGTRKTIGALLEINEDPYFRRCRPKFLLKVTDDTYINMPAFVHWLVAKFPAGHQSGIYLGHTVHGDIPDRNPLRHTYLSEMAYPYPAFPDYNKNPAYLISWDLIEPLAKEISLLQPINIDDVYVGILMTRVGAQPQFNDHFVMLEGPMDVCMHLRMFFISHLPPVEVLNVFERNSQGRRLGECKDVLPYNSDKMDL